mmetsp:Transcript_1081/g.1408  ORF Transcript_1081/g.1408 Transcript_1081/m.1408 type:complete len:172 (+) Transcript_1081:159-674(+)
MALRNRHTPLLCLRETQAGKDESDKSNKSFFPRPLVTGYTRSSPLDHGRDSFKIPEEHFPHNMSLPLRNTPLARRRRMAPAFKELDIDTHCLYRAPFMIPQRTHQIVQCVPLDSGRTSRAATLLEDDLEEDKAYKTPAPPVKIVGHIPLTSRRGTWDEDLIVGTLDEIQTF